MIFKPTSVGFFMPDFWLNADRPNAILSTHLLPPKYAFLDASASKHQTHVCCATHTYLNVYLVMQIDAV